MEKEYVIKIRTILKAGKNLPLMIYVDNVYHYIDESRMLQFVSWDDVNGILYVYKMQDPSTTVTISNKEQGIVLTAVPYDMIQGMETVCLPLNELDTMFASIEASGKELNEGFKRHIKESYKLAFDPNMTVSRAILNKTVGGTQPIETYYDSNMRESFKETISTKRYNESTEEIREKYKDDNK